MPYGTGSYHIQIDVCNATCQMAVGLHSGRVISIFPESTVALFPSVELLRGSPGYQLQRARNLPFALICAKQVYVIGCHHVI